MSNRVGQNRETDEEHDEDCVEESFSWLRQNLTEMVREAGNFWVWGIAVRMFEMNQNRRVTTGMGGGLLSSSSKIEDRCPNLEKKCPDCGHPWVTFLI